MNLYAYCKQDDDSVVKHIPVTREVQLSLDDAFRTQEEEFLRMRTRSVTFDGNYKAEDEEYLEMNSNREIQDLVSSTKKNVSSLEKIDTDNFISENIRALFISCDERLLVQRFVASQLLTRRQFSFLLDKNTFREFSTPAFTIGNRLCCIIKDERVIFDSFSNLRTIFDMKEFYQEATDIDIDRMAKHQAIEISDLEQFKNSANQTIRRLIYKVLRSNVLDNYDTKTISHKAQELGIEITTRNGKIVLQNDQKTNRKLLSFLDDSLFESNLTGNQYVTNSKRSVSNL